MSAIIELFSAVFFEEIILSGIGVLLIPIANKLWRRVKKQEASILLTRLSLIGLVFVFVWLLVGIGSSLWVAFLLFPYGGSRQILMAQIWQVAWIVSGFILSMSARATLGAILGAVWGLFSAIASGCVSGFGIGFLLGLIVNNHLNSFGEQLEAAFTVGLFGAALASFCLALFIGTFTTLGGAILGFLADVFGRAHPYEKMLQRLRIKSDYSL